MYCSCLITFIFTEFGCRRFIVDTGYLEALNRPNVELNYDGISAITEKGILTKKGNHFDFDVIIEATGFIVVRYFPFACELQL